jgi:hypothetical protein
VVLHLDLHLIKHHIPLLSIDVMKDVNEVMKALVAPVRPFGYVFQHFGGSQKCIQGHFQFFETYQNFVTGTMNYLNDQNVNNIFVMICGTTTQTETCHFSQNSSRYSVIQRFAYLVCYKQCTYSIQRWPYSE